MKLTADEAAPEPQDPIVPDAPKPKAKRAKRAKPKPKPKAKAKPKSKVKSKAAKPSKAKAKKRKYTAPTGKRKKDRAAFEPAYRKAKPLSKTAAAFLAKIRKFKAAKDLSDGALAAKLKVNRATFYAIARGDHEPSERFCEAVLKRCK